VEEGAYENQSLSAAVAAAVPIDLVVLCHPKSPAAAENTITVVQGMLGGSVVEASVGEKQVFSTKPFVVVMKDDRAAAGGDDDDGGDDATAWAAAGADVVWHKHASPLDTEIAFSLLRLVLPLPLTWRVLAVEDISLVRRMLVRTLKSILGAGCVVVEAASGREAIAALRVSEEEGGTPFDLFVLDEHLDSQLCREASSDESDEATATRNLKGTDIARRVRSGGSQAIIAGFSGDEMAPAHGAAGCHISWRKTVNAATMRADLLQCLHTGKENI